MRLGLVPVGNRGVVVASLAGVAALERVSYSSLPTHSRPLPSSVTLPSPPLLSQLEAHPRWLLRSCCRSRWLLPKYLKDVSAVTLRHFHDSVAEFLQVLPECLKLAGGWELQLLG